MVIYLTAEHFLPSKNAINGLDLILSFSILEILQELSTHIKSFQLGIQLTLNLEVRQAARSQRQ